MPRFPGFVGGTGILQSLIADAEDTVNFYVERAQSQSVKSPAALFPTPGFSPFLTASDVGGRGGCIAGSRAFAAMGATLTELYRDGTSTNRGALATDSNPAQLFFNGTVGGQIGIASGSNFYVYALATNTLTLVLSGETTMCAYVAGFFLSFNVTTGKVKLSALNDGTNFSGAQFFQRSLAADPWQTMFVDQNNLVYLIGTESFEAWYNTGIGTQPFAPLSGLTGLWGIAAPFAFCRNARGLFWLGANRDGVGEIVTTSGGRPTALASHAFSTAVGKYLRAGGVSDAEFLTYQQEGHTFVCMSFPSVPATWHVDLERGDFARRGSWNSAAGRFDLWSPRVILPAFGKTLALSRTSGVVADMSPAYATEFDGTTGIVRERVTAALFDEHHRIPIDQLELLMDVGLGLQSGQGSNPVVMLRVSEDGGQTFGNERQASTGRIGQYRKRVYWNQLGAPADCVIKVRMSDPVPFRIIDAFVNNAEGMGGRAA